MFRLSSIAVVLVLALFVALPAVAQSNEQLEEKLEALTRRVEALERRSAPARRTPTANNVQARQAAQALYGKVDLLLGDGKLKEAHEAIAAFDAEHRGGEGTAYTAALKRELQVVGKATPDDWFIEEWYQGERTDLDGSPTLLVFWETWCPHCRNEMPKLVELSDEYGAKGLQIVGMTRLTRTATEESVRQFIAEHEIDYPMAKVSESLAEYFNIKGIPAAAVVKGGKIVWRGHPLRLTPALLDKWL